jgi:hypothetical protein
VADSRQIEGLCKIGLDLLELGGRGSEPPLNAAMLPYSVAIRFIGMAPL